jgi:ethanolamine utilization protein EutN
MLTGRVTGCVWSTKRLEQVPNGAFLEVTLDGGGQVVAFDVLGSGVGERVLVATGSVASAQFPGHPPLDALIVGSIDEAPSRAPSQAAGASDG